jgi:outer membrane protein TolC
MPDINSRQTGYSLGVSQRQAFGLVINPVLSVIRIEDSNKTSPSSGNVAINFTLPLLKGWGSAVNTAQEESAKLAHEAATYNYSHTLTASITKTVTSYWDYLGAKKSLDVAKIAETRAETLLDDARKLAQGDEIPASDVIKYEVKLAGQISVRIAAEQRLKAARGALLNAMNITDGLEESSTSSNDDFPEPDQANLGLLTDTENLSNLIDGAKDRRFDVMAAEYNLQSAETLATAAHIDNKSRLDLTVSVGYNGLINGKSATQSYLAFNNPASGANAGATLNYAIPVTNSANRGQVLQTSAAAQQAQIELEALNNIVTTDARVQLNNLRTALAQLEQARKQLEMQTRVYENERRKYHAGLSTVIDLFTNESQLTNYQTNMVDAQRNFAQALILFRFNTGTLLTHGQDGQSIDKAQLTTLPIPSSFMTN